MISYDCQEMRICRSEETTLSLLHLYLSRVLLDNFNNFNFVSPLCAIA